MKKLFATLFAFLFLVSVVHAFEASEHITVSSGVTVDGTAVSDVTGYFYGFAVKTDGTNSITFDLYSGTTSVGTSKLMPEWGITATKAASDLFHYFFPPEPIPVDNIYMDITTSGTTHDVRIYYRSR